MKEIYEKTITSIFIIPTLSINRESLNEHNFINGYLGDVDNELYHELDVVFLLFKPKDKLKFNEFLERERERTKALIDDYNHGSKYVILVYCLDEHYKEDIKLIKQSRYSETSKEFQSIFPKKVRDFNNSVTKKMAPSIQHMIFRKDKELSDYWEKELETFLISSNDLEVWPGFNGIKEILDIKTIK